MPRIWQPSISRFGREEQGSVAIIFGLSSVALFLIIGLGVDYARMVDMRQRLVAAVDSASLAAGRALLDGKLSDDQIVKLARAYFANNSKSAGRMGRVSVPDIRIDRPSGTVGINLDAKIDMTVSQVGGFKTWPVPVTSTAVYKQRDVEVGMALDITGSMGESAGGGSGLTKLAALKIAFAKFADLVIPDRKDGHKARIGLAPYSAGINLGSYAGRASGYRSKDGCVAESQSTTATDDVHSFYVKADGAKDVDPTEDYKGEFVCPTVSLTPLSDEKEQLIEDVKAYKTATYTGGHFGVQWAWNLVSDKWGGVWGGDGVPASFDLVKQDKLIKAVVLMTDGMFNTAFHGAKSSEQAAALCKAMKEEGVVVFTVGFGLTGSDLEALKTLKSCASPGPDYFADASSPAELDAALAKFARKLGQLRISK